MKFFILILLYTTTPDGHLTVTPVPDMSLLSSEKCREKAKLTEEGARASLSGNQKVQVQCIPMSPRNFTLLLQSE